MCLMSRLIFRCDNEYGSDPCEYARSDRTIGEEDAVPSMDGGNPRCPGKTLSGKVCNNELTLIGSRRSLLPRWALGVCGVLLLLFLVSTGPGLLRKTGIFGEPKLRPIPSPLLFPQTKGGVSTADIRIFNDGDSELTVKKIEAESPFVLAQEGKLSVDPQAAATLSIRFESPSTNRKEGKLVLHSNDRSSPAIVILIANNDPWWVYHELETTSKTLLKEQ